MEDLRSLMTCLDDISSKIPDGLYLEMADKMKRVHDHMNGDKPFHEDTFYYSDDDSELGSDQASDSDYEAPWILTAQDQRLRVEEERMRDIMSLRNEIKAMVMRMRGEFKWLKKLDKDVTKTVQIKRMTAQHKSEAIKIWCEAHFLVGEVLPNVELHEWDTVNEAIFVGCVSSVGATEDGGWTWKNLVEWGLRMIVLEIGNEDEIERAKGGLLFRDDLSPETLQKLPAFEKKIYTDYKEIENKHILGIVEVFNQKIKGTEEELLKLQDGCLEREARLRRHGAHVECRAVWDASQRTYINRT
jgi:hypothetical protein